MMKASFGTLQSPSQTWWQLLPVPSVDQHGSQPCVHMFLDSSIVVAGGGLLSEFLVVVYEDIGEYFGQSLSFACVFANLVNLVDMLMAAAAQELEKLVHERIGDVASERGRVVEGVQNFNLEG